MTLDMYSSWKLIKEDEEVIKREEFKVFPTLLTKKHALILLCEVEYVEDACLFSMVLFYFIEVEKTTMLASFSLLVCKIELVIIVNISTVCNKSIHELRFEKSKENVGCLNFVMHL